MNSSNSNVKSAVGSIVLCDLEQGLELHYSQHSTLTTYMCFKFFEYFQTLAPHLSHLLGG